MATKKAKTKKAMTNERRIEREDQGEREAQGEGQVQGEARRTTEGGEMAGARGAPDEGRRGQATRENGGRCQAPHHGAGPLHPRATTDVADARDAAPQGQALRIEPRVRDGYDLTFLPLRAVVAPALSLAFRVRTHGREHLPREGAAILVANHASFLDPIFIATYARRPVRFLVSNEFYRNRRLNGLLRWLGTIPVGGDSGMVRSFRLIAESPRERRSRRDLPGRGHHARRARCGPSATEPRRSR
jgi:hypothetical protein